MAYVMKKYIKMEIKIVNKTQNIISLAYLGHYFK